jgi:S-methylmethionine-dependent homocysteine/selenocysteine methylase
MHPEMMILDGGMSRELMRLGARLVQPEWSALALMESPQIVRQVHAEFIAAGADAITTNSYALVPFHIGEDRFRADGASLIALSGQLAREAAEAAEDRKVLVCGSLPPIFGSYEPQNFNPAQVQEYLQVHGRQSCAHVDGLARRNPEPDRRSRRGRHWRSRPLASPFGCPSPSMTNLVRPATNRPCALARPWPRQPAGACSEPHPGTPVQLLQARSHGIGDPVRRIDFSNLDVSPRIGVYANAFDEETDEKKANDGLSGMRAELDGDGYLGFARSWTEAGATMVGGCCGIGVEQIGRLARELKA